MEFSPETYSQDQLYEIDLAMFTIRALEPSESNMRLALAVLSPDDALFFCARINALVSGLGPNQSLTQRQRCHVVSALGTRGQGALGRATTRSLKAVGGLVGRHKLPPPRNLSVIVRKVRRESGISGTGPLTDHSVTRQAVHRVFSMVYEEPNSPRQMNFCSTMDLWVRCKA